MAASLNDTETRTSVTDDSPRPFLEPTLNLYKSRCLNLEEQLAQQHTAVSQQQLHIAALETKVQLLLECYKEVDEELFTKRRSSSKIVNYTDKEADGLPPSYVRLLERCATLQSQLQKKRDSLAAGSRGQRKQHSLSQATHEGMNICCSGSDEIKRGDEDNGVIDVQEDVARLLRNACRQLAEAREVGGKLLQELGQAFPSKIKNNKTSV